MTKSEYMLEVQRTGLVLVAGVTIVLGACSSTPIQSDMLDQANASYEKANTDPIVARHAALELDNAKRWIERANNVQRQGEPASAVDHSAYIANQRVKIAVHRAAQLDVDEKIERMKVERQEVQIDTRQHETEALQAQMKALQAKQTERGLVMTLGDVLFDTGEATLAPGATRAIQQIAGFMRDYPNKTALIEGHTDSNGNEDMNYDLSVRRAGAVRIALLGQGIEGSRLQMKGFGETLPVASNNNSAGRQANRRVEIIFGDESSI